MAQYSVREMSIANEIDRLEKDLQQLKSGQFMGFDTTSIKETITGASYDFTMAANSYTTRYFYFLADTQPGVTGIFVPHVTVGGLTTIATDAEFDFTIQELTHFSSRPKMVKVLSNIYNNNMSSTLYFRMHFFGTDTGQIIVSDNYNLYL